jgi:hypothetical protein
MGKITSADFVANAVSPGFVGYLPDNLETFAAAMNVAPVVRVDKSTGSYILDSRADALRLSHDGLRTGGGAAKTSPASQSVVTFTCREYADAVDVDANEFADAAGIYDPMVRYRRKTAATVIKLLEDDLVTSFFATSKGWTDQTTPSTKWDPQLSGSPVTDVKTALDTLDAAVDGGGMRIGVCGPAVFRALQRHAELHDFSSVMNVGGALPLEKDRVAAALGLDALIVSSLVRNTAKEGATIATSPIMGDGFLVLQTTNRGFDGLPHALALIVNEQLQTRDVEIPLAKQGSRRIESWMRATWKQVDAGLGVFIDNCLT